MTQEPEHARDHAPPRPRDPRLEIPEILRERPPGAETPTPKPASLGNTMGELGFALAIGIDFLVVAAAGGAGGWFLDRQFGWSPWGLMVGIFVGFAGGLFRLIKRLEMQDRDDKRTKAAGQSTQAHRPPPGGEGDGPKD